MYEEEPPKMANCQNNIRCPCRQRLSSAPAPASNWTAAPATSDFLEGTALAMAYVPWQKWHEIYEPCKALTHGTIFRELDKPFLGKGDAADEQSYKTVGT